MRLLVADAWDPDGAQPIAGRADRGTLGLPEHTIPDVYAGCLGTTCTEAGEGQGSSNSESAKLGHTQYLSSSWGDRRCRRTVSLCEGREAGATPNAIALTVMRLLVADAWDPDGAQPIAGRADRGTLGLPEHTIPDVYAGCLGTTCTEAGEGQGSSNSESAKLGHTQYLSSSWGDRRCRRTVSLCEGREAGATPNAIALTVMRLLVADAWDPDGAQPIAGRADRGTLGLPEHTIPDVYAGCLGTTCTEAGEGQGSSNSESAKLGHTQYLSSSWGDRRCRRTVSLCEGREAGATPNAIALTVMRLLVADAWDPDGAQPIAGRADRGTLGLPEHTIPDVYAGCLGTTCTEAGEGQGSSNSESAKLGHTQYLSSSWGDRRCRHPLLSMNSR